MIELCYIHSCGRLLVRQKLNSIQCVQSFCAEKFFHNQLAPALSIVLNKTEPISAEGIDIRRTKWYKAYCIEHSFRKCMENYGTRTKLEKSVFSTLLQYQRCNFIRENRSHKTFWFGGKKSPGTRRICIKRGKEHPPFELVFRFGTNKGG